MEIYYCKENLGEKYAFNIDKDEFFVVMMKSL